MSDRSEASAAPPEPQAWALRPGEPGDLHFIGDTWMRNYTDMRDAAPGQERRCWQGAVVDRCLSNSQVLVAHPPERPEQILGWVCFRRPNVVHYVYVKPYYRRNGIGRSLLSHAHEAMMAGQELSATHWWNRPHAEGICSIIVAWQRAGGRLNYNPALIFGGKT